MIGELVAFDHWKQQVTLIANSVVPKGADRELLRSVYDDALMRLDQLQSDGAQPTAEPLLSPPPLDPELPDVESTMGVDAYCLAVETAKE